MWKKGEENEPTGRATPPTSAAVDRPAHRTASAAPSERAIIGRSITIRGDVSGDEDLMIQGRIEGTVSLGQHRVTIGPEGRVTAAVSARTVTVEGEVKGDLDGVEQVVLRATATVEGDITSPRVVLEDGATFRGSIDMSAPTPSRAGHAQDTAKKGSGTAPKNDAGAGQPASSPRPSEQKSSGGDQGSTSRA